MKGEIRLGKISSIDYAKGMARVVYHEKDDDVTRLIPLLSHEYKMPPVGSQVLVVHLSNGTEAGVVMGRPWSEKNAPPEVAKSLYTAEVTEKVAKFIPTVRVQEVKWSSGGQANLIAKVVITSA